MVSAEEKKEELASLDDLAINIVGKAIHERASDIHMDMNPNGAVIRFRIDGVLQKKFEVPTYKFEPFLSKLKVLANLDIATHIAPQDGSFEIKALLSHDEVFAKEASNITIRISIFSTVNGESAVLRILNRLEMLVPLEKTEMDQEMISKCSRLFSKSYGMVLITGPSGSGKTVLLYSALQRAMNESVNIVTLEDPVEYRFEGIRQIQIEPDQGLTFAVGMKSILRQDPDIIMIGEIRDPETAEYAIRASLAGRLVMSTIHANTGVGTIARLIDMDLERSLIAYALSGVVSKRLVRKICSACAQSYKPDSEALKYFNIENINFDYKKGTGCSTCNNTGYVGRIGIFEVIELDGGLRSLIIDKAPIGALEDYILNSGITTLKQDALNKVAAGLITVEDAVHSV